VQHNKPGTCQSLNEGMIRYKGRFFAWKTNKAWTMLSCHLCLVISCNFLVFWSLSFDCSLCLIAWYLYVFCNIMMSLIFSIVFICYIAPLRYYKTCLKFDCVSFRFIYSQYLLPSTWRQSSL